MKEGSKTIIGFSKLSKRNKIKWIVENFFIDPEAVMNELVSYWFDNVDQQRVFDGFSENTISNYPLPYSIAPNFLIDGVPYAIPMVTEESSVVAAAARSAKFWLQHGGFRTKVLNVEKTGQVHFTWSGELDAFMLQFDALKERMKKEAAGIVANMEKRGGGVLDVQLKTLGNEMYQLFVTFDTVDSMGANFINTVLESFGQTLRAFVAEQTTWPEDWRMVEIIMSILSNYTPNCTVYAEVTCAIDALAPLAKNGNAVSFAKKFAKAVELAEMDVYRAVTHNKGIFNGMDAVVLATGNDFRAFEANGHAYASKSGTYKSLSKCKLTDGLFTFSLEVPVVVGTIGGLTNLHPFAKRSLELLGNPTAKQLMSIIAAVGLAQNFSALTSLVTTGIQAGHMKMHLSNILEQLQATVDEREAVQKAFEKEVIAHHAVVSFLEDYRKTKKISK